MSSLLQITVIEHRAGRIVRFQGPMDAGNTPAIDQLVDSLIQSPPPQGLVVLDCSEVDFMGSLAFGAFIRLKRHLGAKGISMHMATVPAELLAAIKHARLHQFFEIYDTVEGALGEIVG